MTAEEKIADKCIIMDRIGTKISFKGFVPRFGFREPSIYEKCVSYITIEIIIVLLALGMMVLTILLLGSINVLATILLLISQVICFGVLYDLSNNH